MMRKSVILLLGLVLSSALPAANMPPPAVE